MRLRLAIVASPLLFASHAAFAQASNGAPFVRTVEGEDIRYPVAEAERPLTLPSMVLSPELDLDVAHVPGAFYGNATFGASFGITDDLNVRATVLPLQLAGPSGAHYGESSETTGPSVGATYRFLKAPFELGVSLDLGVVTAQGESGFFITPGVPLRFHLGRRARIDTGAYLTILHGSAVGTMGSPVGSMTSNPTTTTGSLYIPVSFLFDITEPVHVGAMSGFTVPDLGNFGTTAGVPIGVFAGYAVGGKEGPVFDIDPFFNWLSFLTPGGPDFFDVHDWALGVSLGGFIYL